MKLSQFLKTSPEFIATGLAKDAASRDLARLREAAPSNQQQTFDQAGFAFERTASDWFEMMRLAGIAETEAATFVRLMRESYHSAMAQSALSDSATGHA